MAYSVCPVFANPNSSVEAGFEITEFEPVTMAQTGERSGTFRKSLSFTVSQFSVSPKDGFDFFHIPGLESDRKNFLPILPYMMKKLYLPKNVSVMELVLNGGHAQIVDYLSIPSFDPDSSSLSSGFTSFTYAAGLYPDPNFAYEISEHDYYREVDIYFFPVQYDTETGKTTLWTEAEVDIWYEVEECLFISDFSMENRKYRSSEKIDVGLVLENVGGSAASGLEVIAKIKDAHGQLLRSIRVPTGDIPAGGSGEADISIDNGLGQGNYLLVLEITDEKAHIITTVAEQVTVISGSASIPPIHRTSFSPGEILPFPVVYENYAPHSVSAEMRVDIYDEENTIIKTLTSMTTDILPDSSATIILYWKTDAGHAGSFRAVATVLSDEDEHVSDAFHFSVKDDSKYHKADYNQNGLFDFSELLRMIQFFSIGTYHCDPDSEDGYAPGDGDHSCVPHTSDYSPRDWRIGLNEFLRMIQLYSTQNPYYPDPDTEDGFASAVPDE